MPLINWNDSELAPDYFNQDGIFYERKFIDVEYTPGIEYQTVPMNENVTHLCILFNEDNCKVLKNTECCEGSFVLPFIRCGSKEKLLLMISKSVVSLVNSFEDYEEMPNLRIFIYRYTKPSGEKYVAIGGTNANSKNKIIKDLKIKTIFSNPRGINKKDIWESIISEMEASSEETNCCDIEKTEILDFESRRYPVPYSSKDVLTLCSSSNFDFQHFAEPTKDTYHSKNSSGGSFFKLQIVEIDSMEELDKYITNIVKSFRILTGNSSIKTTALFSINKQNKIRASIICHKIEKEKQTDEENEETDSF